MIRLRLFLAVLPTLLVADSLRGDEQMAKQLANLRSAKPSEWRVAQAYLARAGTEALPALEKVAETADGTTRARLKVIVSLMLRSTAAPEQIQAYPKLWQVGETELKLAEHVVKELVGQKKYESGELGLMLVSSDNLPPLMAPRHGVQQLVGLYGYAVPAALALLRDREPGSRMYGVEILGRLDAIGRLADLQRMLKDTGVIQVDRGCYVESTSVGAQIPHWLNAGELGRATRTDRKNAAAFEAESYVAWLSELSGKDRYGAINTLRQRAQTFEAQSWDDYWRRAAPVLQTLWDTDSADVDQ